MTTFTTTARIAASLALLLLAALVVVVWRIGPVVVTATPEHGLHLGDLFALPLAAAAGLLARLPGLRPATLTR